MSDAELGKSFLRRSFEGLKQKYRKLIRRESDNSLRETIEELIEEEDSEPQPSMETEERVILGNVLNAADLVVEDVMVPRADIIAVPVTMEPEELIQTMVQTRLSRLPVYRETLDNIIGLINIKDVLEWTLATHKKDMQKILREILFVSPAMRVSELLFKMKQTGTKTAVVVDEFGGIDGLVTFTGLIGEIIGEIQDDRESSPQLLMERGEDMVVVDARMTFEELSQTLGIHLTVEDLEDEIDTVGGLVVSFAGRVPSRGEVITTPYGVEFEVLDADSRRIKRLRLSKFKKTPKSMLD